MTTDIVTTALAFWLGSLFTYAGALKLITPLDDRVGAVAGFRILPSASARIVAFVLPFAELLFGTVILLTPLVRFGATGTAVSGILFSAVTASALVRGLEAECGCAGRGSGGLVRPSTLIRALAIAASGVVVSLAGRDEPLTAGWIVFGLAMLPAVVALRRRRSSPRPLRHAHHLTGHARRAIPDRV